MKTKSIGLLSIVTVLVAAVPVWPQTSDQIALSLRQRAEKGELVLDILVSNVSATPIEVFSEGIVPPWSIWAWFKWKIDGKPAEYSESVAMIPAVRESWRIPKDGVILWASIPASSLKCQINHELRSAITSGSRHVVTILPNDRYDRWKAIRVKPGILEVDQP